ncbi:PREDICTED: meiotic recombination protein SPO11-1-like isoform X1 [Camelina sativa]|uniref:DNA topoisomerase (ATP-hydrolyzing) n=1 Tax=Camelina sativa TaxID=90675 RepID=A0ABM1QZL5_CAMSA|nr:PREDICTED: meiotic recombination protein SPO11-1-like isoform X1 [Camelina sativa]XP_019092203.1 PREDICTED: meiotic recombination protein SPO11-1-like isoform X1 [Camelina sativa]
MEGKISSSEDTNLLQRIKEFTRSVVEDLAEGRSPKISINRFRNYCMNPESDCFCSSDKPKGQDILTLKREPQTYRIDMLLRVMLIFQQLLQENRHASKRDIYYMHPSAFKAQSVVDRAIGDICILFQCSRYNLNVVSVGNGLVMGWLKFREAGRKFDCLNSLNTAFPVPVLVEEVEDIVSLAEYILVVEKETVFQRLANDMFCKMNRCIVITVSTAVDLFFLISVLTSFAFLSSNFFGKGMIVFWQGRGYPDVSTRRFLRLLIEKLQLPVHCLVDCDPYGFEILATYRFGSMQMAYDIESLRAPDMKWLGAFPSDSEIYNVPKQCLLPLTEEDKKRTEALLLRCYLKRELPQWRLELETMLERGVKFEIEALSVHSLSFLSEVYIPSKIRRDLNSP